jgi:hypothetical protein
MSRMPSTGASLGAKAGKFSVAEFGSPVATLQETAARSALSAHILRHHQQRAEVHIREIAGCRIQIGDIYS